MGTNFLRVTGAILLSLGFYLIMSFIFGIPLPVNFSRKPNDAQIISTAISDAEALKKKGIFPVSKRDSLIIENIINGFWRADRSQPLIDTLLMIPDLECNNPALFGLAVAYAMQKDRERALMYLEEAVNNGDYHLFMSKARLAFDFLEDDPDFILLLDRSKKNHYDKIAMVGY